MTTATILMDLDRARRAFIRAEAAEAVYQARNNTEEVLFLSANDAEREELRARLSRQNAKHTRLLIASHEAHKRCQAALRGWVKRLKALHRAIDEAELATLRARRTGDAMTTEPSGNPRQLPAWFRWMPGMLAVDEHGRRWRVDAGPQDDWCGSYRPDLTDPATLGCLLGLLREVSGDAGASSEYTEDDGRWRAWWGAPILMCRDAPTEGDALWAAIDAAWANRGGA